MSYVYKGAAPLTVTRVDGLVIALKPCGTDAAYKRHLKNGEVACEPCLTAHRIKMREWDRAHNTRPSRAAAPCGTPSAYKRHLRNNETIDAPCRAASTAYKARLRAAKAKDTSNGI